MSGTKSAAKKQNGEQPEKATPQESQPEHLEAGAAGETTDAAAAKPEQTAAPTPTPAPQPIIMFQDPNADLQRDVLLMQRRKLELETEIVEEDAAARTAKKAKRRESIESREKQMSSDRRQLLADAKKCNHRQGGTRNRPLRGNGPTALKKIIFPMGESIRCGVCRMTVFKPHPYNGVRKLKKGESEEQMEERLDLFELQTLRFAEMEESMDANSLTEESASPLNTGAEFRFYTAEMNEVFPPRPNDTYALQY